LILVKELIDNALDAAEALGPPRVEVAVTGEGFSVSDNGPGLPEEIIRGSLDYNVRVSDKSLYVTPTRGQLGNALKCVWAAPFVAHGGHASVNVLVGGSRHTIRVSADQIQGCPQIEHATENGRPVRTGTSVEVGWPEEASTQAAGGGPDFYRLVRGFAALNPHASFRYAGRAGPVTFRATDAGWRKWLPDQRPSPHWYDLGRFRTLVAGKLAACRRSGARPQTVRDFIGGNFCGLTGTLVRSELLQALGLEGRNLEGLAAGDCLDDGLLRRLLAAMKEHARPVQAKKLGLIGEGHLAATATGLFGAHEESVRYSKAVLEVGGLPYVLEVAFGFRTSADRRLQTVTGVNWSPLPRPPFQGLGWLLGNSRVHDHSPCVLIAHLACPRPEFIPSTKENRRVQQAMVKDKAK
jgi:DNA topoisomerase VI subunit B